MPLSIFTHSKSSKFLMPTAVKKLNPLRPTTTNEVWRSTFIIVIFLWNVVFGRNAPVAEYDISVTADFDNIE